jgi:DNA-directed RNA polymerase specialized sigma24 family protein
MNAFSAEEQDAQDMSRLVNGHDTLIERHVEKLFHHLLRSLQNKEDAADLAQEAFVKVFQNRANPDIPRSSAITNHSWLCYPNLSAQPTPEFRKPFLS